MKGRGKQVDGAEGNDTKATELTLENVSIAKEGRI